MSGLSCPTISGGRAARKKEGRDGSSAGPRAGGRSVSFHAERLNILKLRAFFLRWGIPLALLALLVVVTIFINQVERVPLVVREGQTFEKGIVTEILQDNLQPDGSRTGEQVVMVRMTTGVRAGQEMRTTSSSGYLFGAGCTVGMKVVVLQSVAGESIITTVYAQDRGGVIYLFAALYLLVLCLVGGKQGIKGALGLVFTFLCILFVYLPSLRRITASASLPYARQ